MKKILFLTNNMNGGGAEKVLLNILNALDKTQYNIDLLLVFNQGVYLNDIPANINTNYIFDEKTDEAINLIKYKANELCKKYIKDIFYDTVIAFLEGNATKILSYSNSCARKLAWIHIDLKERHYTSSSYLDLQEEIDCYQKYDKIAFVSAATQQAFYNLFGYDFKEKSIVLYNPIDVSAIVHDSNKQQIEKKHEFVICASGRLTSQKGFDRLINAINRLVKNGYNLKLNILGSGFRKDELYHMICNYKLNNHISLMGFCKNPYPIMKASDLFVCSSRTEGYCLVICEALSLEIPVVSTDCTGVREALGNGDYGDIVENSEDGIYMGILNCIDNPEHLNTLKRKAQMGKCNLNYKERLQLIENFIKQ